MFKLRHLVRLASWLFFVVAAALTIEGSLTPGPSSVEIVNLGPALLWASQMVVLTPLAALLNGLSFRMTPRPRSVARKVELGVFMLPLVLAALLALMLLHGI